FAQFGFAKDVGITIWRVLGGFVLAAALGVPLGIAMGAYKPVEAFFEPFVSFARYLPASAFIPLLILWAGIGEMQKLLVIFIGSFFQIVLMVAVTVGATRRDLVEAAYTLGASASGIVRRALLPTTLDVADNDFITILGPSGCGKSTLLRIVAGLDVPTSGDVQLDGHVVTGPGADRGMVFQSYTLFPWLTVRENIGFGLREKRLPAAQQAETVRRFIAEVGLNGFESHYPKQLSGGMQQRVALARALANDPKILLLDEPFGALDNQTRALMQELLLSIWELHKKTVLFVTHDVDEAIFI